MTHGRPILEDALAAFLLDHVGNFDVQDIFSESSLIGEAQLGERARRVVKRRLKGTLAAVQVDLRRPKTSAGGARITSVDSPTIQHAANRNEDVVGLVEQHHGVQPGGARHGGGPVNAPPVPTAGPKARLRTRRRRVPAEKARIARFLDAMLQAGASDLHILPRTPRVCA